MSMTKSSQVLYELPMRADDDDDDGGTPGKRKRRIRFNSAQDAVRLLSKVVNAVLNDTMATDKARTLISAASTLASTYQQIEIEPRLRAVEARLKKQ